MAAKATKREIRGYNHMDTRVTDVTYLKYVIIFITPLLASL